MRTHYQNLQVDESASPEVIEVAFRSLCARYHPDKHPDQRQRAERATQIVEGSFKVLSSPVFRADYDASLKKQRESELALNEASAQVDSATQEQPPAKQAPVTAPLRVTSAQAPKAPCAEEKPAQASAGGSQSREQELKDNLRQANRSGAQSAAQKPQSVIAAIYLLWASFAAGLLKMLMSFSSLGAEALMEVKTFIFISLFALVVWLIFKISSGKNWARIAYLVFFAVTLLPVLLIIPLEFASSVVAGGLSVAQIGLQGYALFLLFTQPGSRWFQVLPT